MHVSNLIYQTQDAAFIRELLNDFNVNLQEVQADDVNQIIYNIYQKAIENAKLNINDFEIDANCSASGLFHKVTEETVYNSEDLNALKQREEDTE